MGYIVVFPLQYTLYDDQIGVISISITLNIYHFFVVTLKILSSCYFETQCIIVNYIQCTVQQNTITYSS